LGIGAQHQVTDARALCAKHSSPAVAFCFGLIRFLQKKYELIPQLLATVKLRTQTPLPRFEENRRVEMENTY
jgi:hypothetical protein